MSIRCYIALGSNLNCPEIQVKTALRSIEHLPDVTLVRHSSLYQSPPLGPQDQPDYVNAVAEIITLLEPETLLDQLQLIEAAQGRERSVHWGARTIDLDILLYGNHEVNSERLTIPHPGMRERNFVVYPLYEIAPGLQLPDGTSLKILLDQCSAGGLKQLEYANPGITG